jgi:DNA-binding NarL/FixJ family response regulator
MTARRRVLLVEDDGRVADIIRLILGDAGFGELEVVHTASRAEMRVKSDRPDLLLVDLGLPDRDGIELIRALRAASVHQPILVVTTATASDRVMEALRSGADGYLFKEDLSARLIIAVRELYEGGAPLSNGAARALLNELRQRSFTPKNDVALPALTPKERRVLDMLSDGASYAEIGRGLDIGVNTVRTHIRSLYEKLGVQNGAQAVSLGWSLGLLRPGAGP